MIGYLRIINQSTVISGNMLNHTLFTQLIYLVGCKSDLDEKITKDELDKVVEQ